MATAYTTYVPVEMNTKTREVETGGLLVTNEAGTTVFNASTGGLTLSAGSTVNEIKDEDNMVSDSDTALATQQSIKAYVDGVVGGATFVGLTDTPGAFTTANAIYTVNAAGNAVVEKAIALTLPGANQFTLTRGTSIFDVTTSCDVDQNLSTLSDVDFNSVQIENILQVDDIIEKTTDHGVEIESVTLKDGTITTSTIYPIINEVTIEDNAGGDGRLYIQGADDAVLWLNGKNDGSGPADSPWFVMTNSGQNYGCNLRINGSGHTVLNFGGGTGYTDRSFYINYAGTWTQDPTGPPYKDYPTSIADGSNAFAISGSTGRCVIYEGLQIDNIYEETAGNGVSVDGVVLKDGGISLNAGATVNDIKDEDDMVSDSATSLATQQSIKAYVDNVSGNYSTGSMTVSFVSNIWITSTNATGSYDHTVKYAKYGKMVTLYFPDIKHTGENTYTSTGTITFQLTTAYRPDVTDGTYIYDCGLLVGDYSDPSGTRGTLSLKYDSGLGYTPGSIYKDISSSFNDGSPPAEGGVSAFCYSYIVQ